ncbi:hypothetical protein [Alloscardovia macacae]
MNTAEFQKEEQKEYPSGLPVWMLR